MLKLVLGGSGSGKTTLLYSRIRARAEQGRRSILLVPEQFTSSTEGRIYRELGDALSGMVDSYSFTSLAEHILSAEGGAAVQTLSDAGRAVLVRRTLEELYETLGDRKLTVCRELTKRYEEKTLTTFSEILKYYKDNEPRGEYVLVIAGKTFEELKQEEQKNWENLSLEEHMEVYEKQGISRKEAMKLVAKDRGISKRDVYQALLS